MPFGESQYPENIKTMHRGDTCRSAALVERDFVYRPRRAVAFHRVHDDDPVGLLEVRQGVENGRADFYHFDGARQFFLLQAADCMHPHAFISQKFVAKP